MNTTIDFYNNHANEYCAHTVGSDMSQNRRRFLAYLPIWAKILDAGCGSGRDSKAFMEQGDVVTVMDGSKAMCHEAEKFLWQSVLWRSTSLQL